MSDTPLAAPAGSGYVFAVADGSEFYIPGAFHVERDDELFLFDDDQEAALAAERDGFPLVRGMEDVPDGVYLDTEENRAAILLGLQKYPEYRTVTHPVEQEPGSQAGPVFT